jgi:hypothetical protein
MDERVEVGERDTGKGPPYRESFPLVATGCGGDTPNGTLCGTTRIKARELRQGKEIVRGDGWHGRLL